MSNRKCPGYHHHGDPIGEERFGGFCPSCFSNLGEPQRKAVLDAVTNCPAGDLSERSVTIINPPISRWLTLAVGMLGGIVGSSGISAWWIWRGH